MISDDDDDDFGIRRREFRFKVLLPNGTSVELTVWSVETEMHFEDFVGLVREKYLELRKKCEWMKKKRDINWKGSGLYLEDAGDNKIRNVIELKNFMPRKCHILRLNVSISHYFASFCLSYCVLMFLFSGFEFGIIIPLLCCCNFGICFHCLCFFSIRMGVAMLLRPLRLESLLFLCPCQLYC